jgi:uncharacterized protein DUF1553/uncharacterized protein DUF1549/cytochrome c
MNFIRWVLFVCAAVLSAQTEGPDADYTRDVEPILRTKCYACHGQAMQMNGLRLDRRDEALAGSHSGAVIVPGESAKSPLVVRVTSEKDGYRMPPAGPGLTPDQIEILRSWIDRGAEWAESAMPAEAGDSAVHWAYRPIHKPAAPSVKQRAAVRSPIDSFVLAKLESDGIAPSEQAGRRTLARRLSLDIRGLPPTPAEVDEYLTDNRPGAYQRLVDRMLASPHYGEKWARHWLDLAHYADSDGYEKDKVRPYAWRYRHWVIDALNADMPYDQFTVEQIAGDLLPGATHEQRVATGFFRNTLTNREAGTDREEARFEQTVNRANTYGTTWIGLSVGCAQCHNHKFDAISQKEYYQFFAFFDKSMEAEIDAPLAGELGPYLAARPEYERKRAALLAEYDVAELEAEWEPHMQGALNNPGESHEWDFAMTQIRALVDGAERIFRTPPDQRTQRQRRLLTNYFVAVPGTRMGRDKERLDRLKECSKKLKQLDAQFPLISQAMTIETDPQAKPSHIHVGGAWDRNGLEVTPGTLAVLPPLESKGEATRLDLARWTISRENPLTARVHVNRVWQELFGRGFVFTSDDFGTQGDTPSHPKLLDWLAAEFMDQGWSQKQLIRTIVTSSTYRQSSHARPDLEEKDPENSLLARQSRLRLPAELVRDSALAVTGLLNRGIGGPSVRPLQPEGVAELGYSKNDTKWETSEGLARYRRGLYVHFQRTTPYPQLMNFDMPDSNVSCTRRERSNTPLQALNLLNDPVFFEAAQALAWRIENEASGSFDNHVDYVFQLCLSRPPTDTEKGHLLDYYTRQNEILGQEEVQSWNMNAWVGLSRVVLNMDEFVTRE